MQVYSRNVGRNEKYRKVYLRFESKGKIIWKKNEINYSIIFNLSILLHSSDFIRFIMHVYSRNIGKKKKSRNVPWKKKEN